MMGMRQARRSRYRPGSSPSLIPAAADLFILLLSFVKWTWKSTGPWPTPWRWLLAVMWWPTTEGSPITLVESDSVSLPEPTEDDRASEDATKVEPGVGLTARLVELEAEVASDRLTINYEPDEVIIRFSEEATFRSGEAAIKPEMIPIIDRVVDVLAGCMGDVVVAGYTDDRPISSDRYRSNWDLSAARAVSVVHQLVLNREVPAERVIAAGRAETHPLVPNDTPENRARNRRVELAIRNPECDDSVPTGDLPVEILP